MPKDRSVIDEAKSRSVEAAKAQAAEYFGFAASESIVLTLEDGSTKTFEVPNPALFDDDQQERWNQLQFEIQQCDRLPDIVIPDHKLRHKVTYVDGEEVHVGDEITGGTVRVEESETFVPARTIRGQLITPYQRTGEDGKVELIKPGYDARVAIALWGEEGYAVFKANGGNSRLVGLIWNRMTREAAEREAADSKSDGSDRGVE
ncbi:hypothetical protein A5742_12565 [Mycolicibacterium fortuitum]|uniref:Tail assembly chaperone n=1 Tax=Mycolicibacterium fortuitum TaxID=1766 RepID=A0ABD6QFB3_MYCFO|nr:hypothetical protein [Mycolicibacterium fortuitum]OMC35496.1 hypothetical protein A5742_12565 [Mycolicibacterium fortuitum]